MTTTTETQVTGTALETRRWRLSRVLVAFVVGFLLVAVAAIGTVLAYEQSYAGKIAMGVSVGGVDVAGLTRAEASAKLEEAFAAIGTGTVTLTTPTGSTSLTYAQLGRRPDVDAMLDQAFAVGRTGNPLERVVEEARTALNRATVAPQVAIDRDVLAASLATLAAKIDRAPSAAVVTTTPDAFVDTPAHWGSDVDEEAMLASISDALDAPDAPSTMTIPLVVAPGRSGRDRYGRDDRPLAGRTDGRPGHAEPRQGPLDDRRQGRPLVDHVRRLAGRELRPARRPRQGRGRGHSRSRRRSTRRPSTPRSTRARAAAWSGSSRRRPGASSTSPAR